LTRLSACLSLAVLICGVPTPLAAQETAPSAAEGKRERIFLTRARERDGWAFGLWGARLVEGTLPRLPINIVRGNFVDGQSLALIVSKPLGTFDMEFGRVVLGGFALEVEGQLLKHFGVEDHLETTLSWVLRSGEIPLGRRASFNLAVANGLSYAFADPKWERGWSFQRGVDTSRLLYHIGLEAELSAPALRGFSAFARLHHRSDAFGAFGPPWSSTQRVGIGVRYRLQ
jgi:hypothetical protein